MTGALERAILLTFGLCTTGAHGMAQDDYLARCRLPLTVTSELPMRNVPMDPEIDFARAIAEDLAPCSRYVLRAFRPVNTLDPEYEQVPAPTPGEMSAYLEAARRHVPQACADQAG